MPTCFICNDNHIEYTMKCQTCSKKECSKCFTECQSQNFKYCFECKCPFCNCNNVFDYEKLDDDIIKLLFIQSIFNIEKLKGIIEYNKKER